MVDHVMHFSDSVAFLSLPNACRSSLKQKQQQNNQVATTGRTKFSHIDSLSDDYDRLKYIENERERQ